MIGFIQGEVIYAGQSQLTILAGDVGYEVAVTAAVAGEHQTGAQARLWVHSAIREQGWDLYGFIHREERDLFRVVQRVPKIGAKTALAMLAVFDAPVLIRVVTEGDVAALSTVPGIGKKTAERVIVELRDMLQELGTQVSGEVGSRDGYEAVQALLGLGYAVQDAQSRVAAAVESGIDAADVEAIVRFALSREGV